MTNVQRPKPIIEIRGVSKHFGPVLAVDETDLDIHEGEFFALLGPSGCGKTTLLRMLAGFEIPSSGRIVIDGEDMGGVEPNKRPVNMVFQSYAVFPHMTVFDNVAYGLKVGGAPKSHIRKAVRETLELVRLGDFEKRMPEQLSGGQRQRVALARALVKKPKVLLLDEPLSALDAKLREAMQIELVNLQHSVGITFVIVTHDQDEALSMADRIAVIRDGRIEQLAAPNELYEYPVSRFVADFIGKMNVFDGTVVGHDGHESLIDVEGLGRLRLPGEVRDVVRVGIAVRPEKTRLFAEPPGSGYLSYPVTVENVAYHGSESHVFTRSDEGARFSSSVQNASRSMDDVAVGDRMWLGWLPDDTLVLTTA